MILTALILLIPIKAQAKSIIMNMSLNGIETISGTTACAFSQNFQYSTNLGYIGYVYDTNTSTCGNTYEIQYFNTTQIEGIDKYGTAIFYIGTDKISQGATTYSAPTVYIRTQNRANINTCEVTEIAGDLESPSKRYNVKCEGLRLMNGNYIIGVSGVPRYMYWSDYVTIIENETNIINQSIVNQTTQDNTNWNNFNNADISQQDQTQPDTSGISNVQQQEQQQITSIEQALANVQAPTFDLTDFRATFGWIWQTIIYIFTTHSILMTTMTIVLSLGFVKTIFGR